MSTKISRGHTRRPKWRVLGSLGAVIVAVVTVAAIVVPIVENFGERSSEAETLTAVKDGDAIGYTEMPAGIATGNEWLVPVAAPFSTFPRNWNLEDPRNPDCSSDQYAWLEAHAHRWKPDEWQYLHIRNSATTGGALSLSNIRFVGHEVASEAWVQMACPVGPTGGDNFPGQPLMIDAVGSPATWGEDLWDDDPQNPVGSPVTVNVSPGQIAQVEIKRADSVSSERTYRGRLIADVVGDDTPVVLAEKFGFTRERLPGYLIKGDSDGRLLCGRPNPAGPGRSGWVDSIETSCTFEEAAAMLTSLETTQP